MTGPDGGTAPTADVAAPHAYYGRLHETLSRGHFAVTSEIVPPRGAALTGIRRRARLLRDWIDAGNVTDGQSALVRMASWAGSLTIQREGVEPVMQLQCRDRNRIALQADLLGASAVHIPNVVLLTGDHPRFGDHPEAKPVFDLDSVQLIWLARTLRDQGLLLGGHEVVGHPRWLIGAVENPFAAPMRFRAERLGKKIAAGVQFVQTQFTFDVAIFAGFMQQVRDLGLDRRCHILAGVGSIRSRRGLEYMRQLPGVYVPDEVVKRIYAVPEDRTAEEGLKLTIEIMQQVREIRGVAGIHVLASGWEEHVPEVLQAAGVPRRLHIIEGVESASPAGQAGAPAETSPSNFVHGGTT